LGGRGVMIEEALGADEVARRRSHDPKIQRILACDRLRQRTNFC